jgi:hypothetical protein
MEMRYRQSETETFSICPRKRQLQYREGWSLKHQTNAGHAAMRGTALAAGCAEIHKGESAEVAVQACLSNLQAAVRAFRGVGGVCQDFEEAPIVKALTHYHAWFHTEPWEVVAVETPLPTWGGSRPDVVVRVGGKLVVVDNKWKWSLYTKTGESKDQARNRTLLEYEKAWQFRHYLCAVSDVYQEPCDTYYIVLGECTPKPLVTVQAFQVEERELERWLASARYYWEDMAFLDNETLMLNHPGAAVHESKYGPCEFQWACFEAGLDRGKMEAKYVQIGRGTHAI